MVSGRSFWWEHRKWMRSSEVRRVLEMVQNKTGMKLSSKAVTVGGEEGAEGLSELSGRMH